MPLRILYVITKANWGGAQRYVYDLATAAHNEGHEVLVIAGAGGVLTQKLEAAGVATLSLSSLSREVHLGTELKVFSELRHAIKEFDPDIVHGNSSKAGGLAALAARTSGNARAIFTAHGWAFNENRPKWQKALIWLLHYATVLLSHQTICVSEAARNDARMMLGAQKKLSVIHNGIGPIDFLSLSEARARLAPEATQSFWIGTIAELHPTKQIHVLIRAFKDIAHAHPETLLVLMGDGEERERLTALVSRFGIQDRVIFCGHVDEASRYLKALDVFVLPSRSEGLAYVLIEAGRAGIPVVASKVGGIPEVVQNGVSGVLVKPGSHEQLISAIRELIRDPELRTRLATNLTTRVETEFSLNQMVAKTLALYRS